MGVGARLTDHMSMHFLVARGYGAAGIVVCKT